MMAGTFPAAPSNQPLPAELLAQLISRTNLVYYDWEITGQRLVQWHQINQAFSVLPTPGKLPEISAPTAGPQWLVAISPLLGNSATDILLTSPQELTLVRKSHLGLTGFELVALVKWLEAPEFPGVDLPWPFVSPRMKDKVPPKP